MSERSERKDPVLRMVCDCTAEELVEWMVKYHGLPPDTSGTVTMNLREQFKWHRLQGRLDQNTTAGLIAQLLVLRADLSKLDKPVAP